jgi:anti-sigma-K factor RskA
MNDHDLLRELAGGFVLGALDPEERHRFETHLAGCADCRSEVAFLAPIPGLLSRLDATEAEPLPESVAARAAARARSEWVAMVRSRGRWRWAAAAAAVLAVVLGAMTMLPRSEGPDATPLAIQSTEASGEVAIEARPWGTAVHLDLEGLPQRDRYVVWVVDDAGGKQQAATWGPTPAGIAFLAGASSTPADRVTAVVVTGPDGAEALVTATVG